MCMASAVADKATFTEPTASARIKTRSISVEVHTLDSLADLLGVNAYVVTSAWYSRGEVPHATRVGDEYFVVAEHADRLRALRAGTSAERVYRRENDADARVRAEADREIEKAIAKADAQCARDKAAGEAERKRKNAAYLAREARGNPVDITVPRPAHNGIRVV